MLVPVTCTTITLGLILFARNVTTPADHAQQARSVLVYLVRMLLTGIFMVRHVYARLCFTTTVPCSCASHVCTIVSPA